MIEMLPVMSIDNTTDSRSRNERKSFVDCLWSESLREKFSYLKHLFSIQDRFTSSDLSNQVSFLLRVLHVFFVGSKEKMVGVYTSRIVARMADFFAFWNWTKFESPRKPMGAPYSPVIPPKTSISAGVYASHPNPTSITDSFFNVPPKPGHFVLFARHCAKKLFSFFNAPRLNSKLFSAGGAFCKHLIILHTSKCMPTTLGAQ